jgi:[ribosomal protein S5]-alanine N-acetyltransferase
LGIFVRTDGTHIGNIKFEPIDEREGYAVMGILIGDASWRGKGVTTEVLEPSTAWLAEHRGIREVVLGVERDHSAAIHAYEKAGFRIEATHRITVDPSSQISMVRRLPVSGPVLFDD